MNQDRSELQKNIDVSGAYQPDGPVKADVTVAKKPEHVDFRVVRNESLIRLEELIEELKSSKEHFQCFKSKLSPGIEEARRSWYRKKPVEHGRNSAESVAWANSDPELKDLPGIRAAELRVSNLKAQLAEAESDLSKLQSEGTPRQKYTRAIIYACTVINSTAGELQRAALAEYSIHPVPNYRL